MKKILQRVGISLAALLVLCSPLPVSAAVGSADSTYYNVGILTNNEISALDQLSVGTVIVMTPQDNVFYTGETAENMVTSNEVRNIAMPGVGSSSLGAAAFAKHIATAKGVSVAVIVTGMGDGSVYTEGPEGYFIGRPSNMAGVYYQNAASQKLIDLYLAGAQPQQLVGHSKGNMDIANALFYLRNAGFSSLYQGVIFKTFGCGVFAPTGVTLVQYIGALDSLGTANTVNWFGMIYLPGRYHTTNPAYPFTYLPIERYV